MDGQRPQYVVFTRAFADSQRFNASESFSTLCTIHADTSRVAKKECKGPQGIYYTQKYDIVLSCGLTELKARISWKDNKVRSVFFLGFIKLMSPQGQEKWYYPLHI